MAYKYYCLNCGKTLSQETVLFDLQHLLIEDENTEFNTLRLRLTLGELTALIASGTPVEENYRSCTLPLAQIMGYISNENNLNDPRIAGLTMEQICQYTEVAVPAVRKTSATFESWDDEDEDAALPEEEAEPEAQASEAILALEAKVTAMVGDAMASELLKRDLEYLKNTFYKGEYVVKLKEKTEPYGQGQEVLVGFSIQYPVSHVNASFSCRICPHCGKHIPKVSGTAEHKSVVFIGNPASGKTSTILALTHYAQNYMVHGLAAEIWGDSKRINTVRTIDLVEPRAELRVHKENYAQGIAPERTDKQSREDAYSATFIIKTASKTTLLTLTDLPGEICNITGRNEVDENAVRNRFQVATACDAFVVCFDTESVRSDTETKSNMTPGEIISSICNQADTFQRLRKEKTGRDFIPTMLLFTKCWDLEKNNKVRAAATNILRPTEKVYMFREEKRIIDENSIYQAVCNAFNETHQLARAYHAMLRCSPFGYAAPGLADVASGKKKPEIPTPKNIDHLMHWLLMVSGCVPVEASYCPSVTGEGGALKLNDYYINRVQCRAERPDDEWRNTMSAWNYREALSRWRLFENPGSLDRMILEDYGQSRAVMAIHKLVRGNERNDR